jgi:hypothetical protein
LRADIIETVPRFPNDGATLRDLEQMSLASLLVVYLNWARRIIPSRLRNVVIEPSLTVDRRWKRLRPIVQGFLEKVRVGEDLTPHLSLRVKYNGYTPASMAAAKDDRWEDKDFLLIVMGYHHFHLGQQSQHGHTERTDDLLFAQVTRDWFHAIALFDHSVFDKCVPMTAERERMWRLYDYRSSLGRLPGIHLEAGLVATSGHSLNDVRMAQEYARIIREFDPKLDELQTRSAVFPDLPHQVVKAQKLSWRFNGQDLGLIDRATQTFFILRKGPA